VEVETLKYKIFLVVCDEFYLHIDMETGVLQLHVRSCWTAF